MLPSALLLCHLELRGKEALAQIRLICLQSQNAKRSADVFMVRVARAPVIPSVSEGVSVQARLSRFQGATAISSADFYDNGDGGGGSGGAGTSGTTEFDVSANELMSKLSFQARCVPSQPGHTVVIRVGVANITSTGLQSQPIMSL